MPLPELECFKFKIEPDPGDLTSIDPGIRKNVSTTNVNVPLEDDQSSLFTYVVWIFLCFSQYPLSLHIFSLPGMRIPFLTLAFPFDHSFMPDVSHRSGTFMKFNVYPNHLNESPMMILSSTCSPMDNIGIRGLVESSCDTVNKTRRSWVATHGLSSLISRIVKTLGFIISLEIHNLTSLREIDIPNSNRLKFYLLDINKWLRFT
ncbi:hypothetical protein Tco_1568699 [Tanacetum coccineum]